MTCPKCGSRELRGRVTRKEAYRAWQEGRYVVSPDEREYWEGSVTILEVKRTGLPKEVLAERKIKEVENGIRHPYFLDEDDLDFDYSWLREYRR